MSGYLIYHPRRSLSLFDETKVYHDRIRRGNQDPYIWNKQFLHTYCHITQMRFTKGDINFWVSGDTFPDFSHLCCDLVFVVQDVCPWKERNHIDRTDPIVDSMEAFIDHYRWPDQGEHPFKRRHRFTLKANPDRSFQPQNADQELIDIVLFLVSEGLSLETLRQELRAHPTKNRGSKPFLLEERIAISLYDWLESQSPIKLKGDYLQKLRQQRPETLSSDRPRHRKSSKKVR